MSNTLRIKRRATGQPGAPSSLKNAELAFNEVDNVLYYGTGTDVNGDANTVIAIAGFGAFTTLSTSQTISGDKTFTSNVSLGSLAIATTKSQGDNSNSVATTSYVDSGLANIATSFNITGDTGTAQTIVSGTDTVTIAGGTGISTVAGNTDTITINNDGVLSLSGTSNEITVSAATGNVTIGLPDDVIIAGNLTVNGTTTTINSTTISVDDKNLELGSGVSPTDTTADGGGITLKGSTDKTFNWSNSSASWTSSENIDLAAGKTYRIGTASVLSNTTLGSSVINSSLTSVGTIGTGVWQGTAVAIAYGGTGASDAGTARTNLGLGTISTQNSNNVSITGGTIDNITIDGGTF